MASNGANVNHFYPGRDFGEAQDTREARASPAERSIVLAARKFMPTQVSWQRPPGV
jgi:hypothetical protein